MKKNKILAGQLSLFEDFVLSKPIINTASAGIKKAFKFVFSRKNIPVKTEERLKANIEAINVLANEKASVDELTTISRYTGWNGMKQILECHSDSVDLYNQFITSTKEDELMNVYVDNSMYTDYCIVDTIYSIVDEWGFRQGNIGIVGDITRYLSAIPDILKEQKDIHFSAAAENQTALRIATKLFEDIPIFNSEWDMPASFYDVIVGTIPGDGSPRGYEITYSEEFLKNVIIRLRPDGICILAVPKAILDCQYDKFRETLANEATLKTAIRLPESVFNGAVYDIVIFQKTAEKCKTWIDINTYTGCNKYFDYYTNIIGELQYDEEIDGDNDCIGTTVVFSGSLKREIKRLVNRLEKVNLNSELGPEQIAADYEVLNYSYTLKNGLLYYRTDSVMNRVICGITKENRIKGLIKIRNAVIEAIRIQKNNGDDNELQEKLKAVNEAYDEFVSKFGYINNRNNIIALRGDSTIGLLKSIEIPEGKKDYKKGPIFFERILKPKKVSASVDNAEDALTMSISERGKIDIPFMCSISGLSEDELVRKLDNRIFVNPDNGQYVIADEYLSGDVVSKLDAAKDAAACDPAFQKNVDALTAVQPEKIPFEKIKASIGASWIPVKIFDQFAKKIFQSPSISVIKNKDNSFYVQGYAIYSIEYKIFGTDRIRATDIFYHLLNNKPILVKDSYYDYVDKKTKYKTNMEETMLARVKADEIKIEFTKWLAQDPDRVKTIEEYYNDTFNRIRLRHWNGKLIAHKNLSSVIKPYPSQLNAVSRILHSGKNVLIGHKVGKGKTAVAIMAAMELRRLGVANKPMIVVPNNIIEQWSIQFYRLYPSANILVQTDYDNTPDNRLSFMTRIATGDYDAVIVSHSFFDNLYVSKGKREELFEKDRNLIKSQGYTYTSYIPFNSAAFKKSDEIERVLYFEDLGVDYLFVDESHHYKNLKFATSNNYAGLSSSSNKAENMLVKARYINDIQRGKGVVFMTGTPIDNSLAEMYSLQRYLDFPEMVKKGVFEFDRWAATFAEIATTLELAPEGTGYRLRTRFAKFYNLQELCTMFRYFADIVDDDEKGGPEIPEIESGGPYNVIIEPSEYLNQFIQELSKRADLIRSRNVDPKEDNMLKITSEGRKAALDIRLIGGPEVPGKVHALVERLKSIYYETADDKLTQIVFCDLHKSKEFGFDVFDDIRDKLIASGIPKEEISIISEAKSDKEREDIFEAVRNGNIRIIMGTTKTLGTGVNVQDLMFAEHHLDCPWKPADLSQRDGRIIRQGNRNKTVRIYRYATKGSFDTYMWQVVENKQRFISQVMNGALTVNESEDVDDMVLSYAEIKALSAADPRIKEKMEADIRISQLTVMQKRYEIEKENLRKKIGEYPTKLQHKREYIERLKADVEALVQYENENAEDHFSIEIDGEVITTKTAAANKLFKHYASIYRSAHSATPKIGKFRVFEFALQFIPGDTIYHDYQKQIIYYGNNKYTFNSFNGIAAINDMCSSITSKAFVEELEKQYKILNNMEEDYKKMKEIVDAPFVYEDELRDLMKKSNELEVALNMNSVA